MTKRKAETINCPFLDKRTKWLPCQRERCAAMHLAGVNISDLAKIFNVSRRTIMFELYPERREQSRKNAPPPKYNPELTKRYRDHLKEIKKKATKI